MPGIALWLTLVGMGLLTYGIRVAPILLWGRLRLPHAFARALHLVPPAVLAAIVFPEVLRPNGALDLSPGNFRLLAGLVAGLVAWRTKNAILTIAAGMAVLWALQALVSR